MKLFLDYIKEKKEVIGLLAFYLAAVCLVYSLYDLSPGPAYYTCLLTGAVSLVLLLAGFLSYRKKREILSRMKTHAEKYLDEEYFPKPSGAAEKEYQELLKLMERRLYAREEESRKQLTKAGEYYTRWSHQIKTPIQAMELLLAEENVDTRALKRELLKTRQYVEMALSYQRMEGDGNDLVIGEYVLKSLVMQAVKKISPLFIHKKIRLELGDLSGQVLTDEKWLVFVLEQLLTNAVKYTDAGGQVIIGREKDKSLCIQDTGIGISPGDLPRIFEWGYTGYNGRMDSRSTGIGLSLVKRTMDMLGHGIRITSKVGEGTKVILYLEKQPLGVE